MISLTAIENKIYDMIGETDDIKLVCVNIPDDKKGEKIILVIDHKIENLKSKLLEFGMTPLWIPSEIKTVEQVPVLGSGKVDFKGAKELVLKSLAL
ncbi:MAG: hypothetical protein U9R37_02940 [Campylobacterota bacterium]|nr:hypothetical protein [Campylobacterota bacterium]